MNRTLLALLLALVASFSVAQDAASLSSQAMEAYGKRDFAKAAQLLKAAVEKDPNRVLDWYNGACSFALIGDKVEAFRFLNELVKRGYSEYDFFRADGDFAGLKNDPRWPAVEAGILKNSENAYYNRGSMKFWDGTAIGGGYKEKLTEEERVAGVSKLWSEVKYNFAHFNRLPLDFDWDAAYMQALGEARAAKSGFEYYNVLRRMTAKLNDGLTVIEPPRELETFLAQPPIRTKLFGDALVVVASAVPEVKVGDQIVQVDGVPVDRYASERVAPFVSASTPHNRRARTYEAELLAGPLGKKVALTLSGPDGSRKEVSVVRVDNAAWKKAVGLPEYEFKMLPGNVAYLAFNTFENGLYQRGFQNDAQKITAADALIIDVRENENSGRDLFLPYLAVGFLLQDGPSGFDTLKSYSRHNHYSDRFGQSAPVLGGQDYPMGIGIGETFKFTKPLALLAGPRTREGAERFLMVLETQNRGTIVGSPTAGAANHDSFTIRLPGGFKGVINAEQLMYPDGRAFSGVGILPEVTAETTVEDFRSSKDATLEAALGRLAKNR